MISGIIKTRIKEDLMKEEHQETICKKLADVGSINPKSGVAYAVSYFSRFTRIGIGISRREITRSTGELSPFIHSWSTFHRYLGIAKDFAIFCKSEKANKLHKITYSLIEKFILCKIKKGRTRNTIESNMCALIKFLGVCGREDLGERLSRDYGGYKYLAREGQRIYSFDKPTELIIRIGQRDELAGVVAQIVRITGVRIHELRPLVMDGTSALIKKGKGGKERTVDFMYQAEDIAKLESLLARFRELCNNVNWKDYSTNVYQDHVRAACRSMHDEYHGAHGLRATFSRDRNEVLKKHSIPDEEREYLITRYLGHNRRSMARHYLRS